jgi:hypothetical protein
MAMDEGDLALAAYLLFQVGGTLLLLFLLGRGLRR